MPAPLMDDLPTAPSRTDEPAVFITRADALVEALQPFVDQANALAAYLDALVGGTLDSDLAAIAALSTAPFGRALLELADEASGRAAFGAAPARLTVEPEAGATYDLVAADAGKHKRFTNAAAVVTVQAGQFSPGDRVRVTDVGGGLTLDDDGGAVTLNSRDGALTSAGAFAVIEIECVGTDEFDCLGDLA